MASSKTITNILLVIVMATAASAATYTVGDSSGWIIPATPNFYDTWAASKTFRVNDKLVFNFPTGIHTAVRVSEKEYKACTFANPIETYSTGPATVTLKETGAHYYLCSIPGHCSAGQKVSINVVSAASSPPPSKAPSAPSPVARPPTRVPNPPASSSPPTTAPSAPSPSPLAMPPASIATPPASSSPPTMAPSAPSPLAMPPASIATPPAPFSIPPTKSLSPSFPPSSLASPPPPPPPGSPSPSSGTPPSTPAAGAPGTSSTPPIQPTASAASFSRGFKWTTFLALVLAFTFVW